MRKKRRRHWPLYIWELDVETVISFKYLGVHISNDLTWALNTTQPVKRPTSGCIFCGGCGRLACHPRSSSTTAMEFRHLQRAIKTAEKINRAEHLLLQSPQESCLHSQRLHLRPEVQKCEVQSHQTKELFLSHCHQIPKKLSRSLLSCLPYITFLNVYVPIWKSAQNKERQQVSNNETGTV